MSMMQFVLENTKWTICIIAVAAIVAILILAFLEMTESRPLFQRALCSCRCMIVCLSSVSILLLFAIHFIPDRNSNGHNSASNVGCSIGMTDMSGREFYHDCFVDLLTVLSVLGTIFGIVVPIGAYFLQRNSLKDEAAVLIKEVDSRQCGVISEIDSLKKVLPDVQRDLLQSQTMRSWMTRNGLEIIRSNLDCLVAMYGVTSVSIDEKERLIKSYWLEFVLFLRLITVSGTGESYESDIKRFRDAVTLFRKDIGAYRNAIESIKKLSDDPVCAPLPNLRVALSNEAYSVLQSELIPILPSLVSDCIHD